MALLDGRKWYVSAQADGQRSRSDDAVAWQRASVEAETAYKQ
ncbi:MAG: hypothetical protein ABSA18_14655 [Dehalococcoidia bacterium]